MAKLINWNNFNKGFGETFNYTLNNERRLQQQQAQFNQEMEYRNRQSDLDQDYRNSTLDISRENLDINKTGQKIDIMKGLLPSQEGGAGAMTGGDWEKQTGVDLYPEDKEKDFYSMFQEATPEATTETGLTPMYGGQVETEYEVDPVTGEKKVVDYGSFFRPFESQMNGGGDGTGNNKPDLLKQKFERDAFGRLVNPQSAQKPPEGVDPTLWMLMGGGKQYSQENDFTTVATGLLKDSDMLKKIQTIIQNEGGYPSGQRLVDALEPQLDDKQLSKLQTFLDYYDQFEKNLPKNQTPMKTY